MSNQKDNLQRINVTSFENKNNSSNKDRQPTIARLLAIASILVISAVLSTTLIGNSFAQAANNNNTATSSSSTNTTSSANSRDCLAIAANIGGQAAPRPDICDVLILRQSPQIKMQSTNMSLNKFSTTNSLVEFMAMNTTKGTSSSSSTSNPKVFVMGEFGLLESQLAPMLKAANNYNWTVSAIHNHMILEKPKLIFMHWSAQGDLNTITTQIKNALLAVSKVPGSSSGST
jgi:Domain of Unknown Function (DUF1259)